MAKEHYLNNKDFLSFLIDYKKEVKEAKKRKKNPPDVTDKIGACFLKIAENLARRPNFASYTFREDMVSEAVENCIRCVDNFDPLKSKNPFAYFTQIIYFAFLRKISNEKKQLYIKYKATQALGMLQDVGQGDVVELGQEDHQFRVYENIGEFIETFERTKRAKLKASKKKVAKTMSMGILKFVGDK